MKTRVTIQHGPNARSRDGGLFETAFRSTDPRDPDILWLVNTEHRKNQLAGRFRQSHQATFETPVLTFSGLYRLLARELDASVRSMGRVEKEAILHRILRSGDSGDLRNFKPAIHLRPHLSHYIAFVKSLNIEDQELLRLRYARFRSRTTALDEALIEAFAEYQRILATEHLEDWEGTLNRVHDQLLTGQISLRRVFPAVQALHLEGLDPQTQVERSILRLICQEVSTVCISLENPENNPDALQDQLDFLPSDVDIRWMYQPAETGRPERFLLRPPNREAEIVWVAHMVRRLRYQDPGLTFSGIAVVCPHPEAYRALISEVFSENGILYFLPGGIGSGSSAFLAVLTGYLEVLLSDFAVEPLLDMLELTDGVVKLPPTRSLREFERLIQRSRSAESSGSGLDQLRELGRTISDVGSPVPAFPGLEETLMSLLALVDNLALETTPARTFTEWCEMVLEKSALLFEPGRLTGEVARLENLFCQTLCSRLREEALAWQSERLSFNVFSSIVREHISRLQVVDDFRGDAVVVGTPEELQQCDFDVVFWVGLLDGEFPSARQQQLFFEDVHTRHWGQLSWRDRFEKARRLFRVVSSAASRAVFYSAPERIGDTTALPSLLLLEAEVEKTLEFPTLQTVEPSARPETASNIRRGRKVQSIRETSPNSAFDGFIRSPATRSKFQKTFFGKGIHLSPNRLEEYHRCGYRFFLSRVLGIEDAEREADRAERDFGNLIHNTLFRFAKESMAPQSDGNLSSKGDWLSDGRARMKRILDEELAALPCPPSLHVDAFWRDRMKKLAAGLDGLAGKGLLAEFLDQTWAHLQLNRVAEVEAKLGPFPVGSIVVGRSDRPQRVPVFLKGKVDRLDQTPQKVLIIDYKTGRLPRDRAFRGWGFQLPLYAYLVQRTYPGEDVEAAFYSIRLPFEVKLHSLEAVSSEAIKSVKPFVSYYRRKALRTAVSLYRGRFPFTLLSPGRAGCKSCDFRQVCRYDSTKAGLLHSLNLFPKEELLVERGRWVAGDARPGQTASDSAS